MIIVTNRTKAKQISAGIEFKPGETEFKNKGLSDAKLAQIAHHPALKWVKVEDEPNDAPAKKETK